MFKARSSGFTLVEMLVAVAIFALISAIGYAALGQSLTVYTRIAEEQAFWERVQLADAGIQRDLAAAVSQAPRAFPGEPVHAFHGDRDGRGVRNQEILGFSAQRASTSGTAGPSPYARISYALRDGVLSRAVRSRLDVPPGAERNDVPLLEDMQVRLRFLDSSGRWVNRWPAEGERDQRVSLPRAVEMTFSCAGRGPFVRIFPVAQAG